MKKIIFLLLIIGLSIPTFMYAGDDQTQQIELHKVNGTAPRSVILYPVSFDGILYMDEITLTAENYQGSVEVIITGPSTMDETITIDNTGIVTLDAASLASGTYTITVITAEEETFQGSFTI